MTVINWRFVKVLFLEKKEYDKNVSEAKNFLLKP